MFCESRNEIMKERMEMRHWKGWRCCERKVRLLWTERWIQPTPPLTPTVLTLRLSSGNFPFMFDLHNSIENYQSYHILYLFKFSQNPSKTSLPLSLVFILWLSTMAWEFCSQLCCLITSHCLIYGMEKTLLVGADKSKFSIGSYVRVEFMHR